jgi:hypothetical protein
MKIKELIQSLQTKDPEDLVVVSGYEGGFNEVTEIKPINICGPFKKEWYYGKYDICPEEELLKIKAVHLE